MLSLGFAFLFKNILALTTPNVLPWLWEGVVVGVLGVAAILVAMYGLYRTLRPVLFASESINGLADALYTRRSRGRGPRIVAIGGGTGLSVLLRGLKTHSDNISAVVTVADDGGSSGRLRRELGVLPPGDFRNCLVAMAGDESLVGKLFQHRFDQGDGLEGHSFGNLFITAMTDVTGSFEEALYESSRVLAIHGRILPSTVSDLNLSARLTDGPVVVGESAISERGDSIEEVMIEPADVPASERAVEAILDAQLVLIGPGSLYTSILPNLLIPGIANALRESSAPSVYVCNVATQIGGDRRLHGRAASGGASGAYLRVGRRLRRLQRRARPVRGQVRRRARPSRRPAHRRRQGDRPTADRSGTSRAPRLGEAGSGHHGRVSWNVRRSRPDRSAPPLPETCKASYTSSR